MSSPPQGLWFANPGGSNSMPSRTHSSVQRTRSLPVHTTPHTMVMFQQTDLQVAVTEPDINNRLESLCLSMTEHALGVRERDSGSQFLEWTVGQAQLCVSGAREGRRAERREGQGCGALRNARRDSRPCVLPLTASNRPGSVHMGLTGHQRSEYGVRKPEVWGKGHPAKQPTRGEGVFVDETMRSCRAADFGKQSVLLLARQTAVEPSSHTVMHPQTPIRAEWAHPHHASHSLGSPSVSGRARPWAPELLGHSAGFAGSEEENRHAQRSTLLMRVRNSSRVLGSSRNTPSMVLVTVLLFIFCTPLITMHM
ncbi:hypothetical protein JZ751_003055 [Albula glossodonta]|uniref:Uncharacterized protein n=1 Tax=Albula glossodonta TaxID=121402 RepID=A0A8T2NJV7_9TELE|nr:hypothetical protein JZ751_003055 [Albula glossodonta]